MVNIHLFVLILQYHLRILYCTKQHVNKKILLLLFVTTTTMSYGAEKASIEISLRKTQDSIIYIASPIKGITLGFTDTLYVTEGKR